ncbi:MAG: DUF2948 family protein [Alphaproteobacteria bacterium]
MTDLLKLRADSSEDLLVMSSVLQDAITRVGDIKYRPTARSLTLRLSRFRKEDTEKSERILTGLRFDGVMSLKAKSINASDPESYAVLLSMTFEPAALPAGHVSLIFAGGGELRAGVEALDVTLTDISEPRSTDKTPLHPDYS